MYPLAIQRSILFHQLWAFPHCLGCGLEQEFVGQRIQFPFLNRTLFPRPAIFPISITLIPHQHFKCAGFGYRPHLYISVSRIIEALCYIDLAVQVEVQLQSPCGEDCRLLDYDTGSILPDRVETGYNRCCVQRRSCRSWGRDGRRSRRRQPQRRSDKITYVPHPHSAILTTASHPGCTPPMTPNLCAL